jgi:hypothetical protein
MAGKSSPTPEKRDYQNLWTTVKLQAKNEEWQMVCAIVFGVLVESVTPGHDGRPRALVPLNWAVSEEPVAISGTEREVRLVLANVAASS